MNRIGYVLSISLLMSCGSGGGSTPSSSATTIDSTLTGNSQSTPTTDLNKTYPSFSWETATPSEVSLSDDKVLALRNKFTQGSFILVKDGYIIDEAYHPFNRYEPQLTASLTKSIYITSYVDYMDEAKISWDANIIDYVDWWFDIEQGSAYTRSFRDLMAMKSGFVSLKRLDKEWYLNDPFSLIKSTTSIDRDYGHWYYNNGNIVLQTIALQNECNCDVRDWVVDIHNLLGIRSADLTTTEQGDPTVYGGIYMDLPDLARYGYFWSRSCLWDETQVMPKELCDSMFETQHTPNDCLAPDSISYPDYTLCEGMSWNYGYGFYNSNGWIFGSGAGNKFILFHETYDIVMVAFGLPLSEFFDELNNLLY